MDSDWESVSNLTTHGFAANPGDAAARAVNDLLSGDAAPGGKLPVTWPRSIGQVPLYYAQGLKQIPHDAATRYWDESSAPSIPSASA